MMSSGWFFGRLAKDARTLIEEEQLNIWTAVGVHHVYSALDEWARNFRSAIFIAEDEDPTMPVVADEVFLRDSQNWMVQNVGSADTATALYIGQSGGGCESIPAWTSFQQAERLWSHDEWRKFSHVVMRLPWPLRPPDFFGTRLQPYFQRDESLQLFILRCAGVARGKGATVSVVSDEAFWCSCLSLPFR